MKKYITLAALLAVGSVFANAKTTKTYEPLQDTTTTAADGEALSLDAKGWITGEKYNYSMSIDSVNNKIANSDSDWYGDAATYRFEDVLTLNTKQYLDFSFDFERTAANTVQSIALVGTTQAIVIGHGDYANTTDLSVGISSNVANVTTGAGAHGYVFAGTANQGFIASTGIGASLAGGMPVATAAITGHIEWDGDSYGLTLTSDKAAQGSPLTYDLGATFDIRDLVFTFDGSNQTSLSNLEFTVTTIPEPSVFGLLAGLGALALVGTRRRRR